MVESKNLMIDAIDIEILMHRDIHFGGSFEAMVEYYQKEGVGVMPDFEIDEIKKLQTLEDQIGKNISDTYLSEEAQKTICESRKIYQDLREVYSTENTEPNALLLSDLILTEEEVPTKEIHALIQKRKEVVPLLIHLISSHSFYDPLYPGYGRTPIFAAQCLAAIQDDRAIIPLFEALGQNNFFTDEEIIKSLVSFGTKSKEFLIKTLKHFPISKDNEYAAIALSGFPEDAEIALASLEVLEDESVQKKHFLVTYLIFACVNLTKADEQSRFIAISKKTPLQKHFNNEIAVIIKNWKKTP